MQGKIYSSIEEGKIQETENFNHTYVNALYKDIQAQDYPNAGVPPPEDQSEKFNQISCSSIVFSDNSQLYVNSGKLTLIKENNDNLWWKLKEAFLSFKKANNEFIEFDMAFQETQPDFKQLLEIKKKLQTIEIQVLQSENEILKFEKENIELESKIEKVKNKRLLKGICSRCIIF